MRGAGFLKISQTPVLKRLNGSAGEKTMITHPGENNEVVVPAILLLKHESGVHSGSKGDSGDASQDPGDTENRLGVFCHIDGDAQY